MTASNKNAPCLLHAHRYEKDISGNLNRREIALYGFVSGTCYILDSEHAPGGKIISATRDTFPSLDGAIQHLSATYFEGKLKKAVHEAMDGDVEDTLLGNLVEAIAEGATPELKLIRCLL